jgi:hypothetical protein
MCGLKEFPLPFTSTCDKSALKVSHYYNIHILSYTRLSSIDTYEIKKINKIFIEKGQN